MERSQQKPGRDPNALRHVIILPIITGVKTATPLAKNHDQVRRMFKIGLFSIRTERRKSTQPLVACFACIERALFLLGSNPKVALEGGSRNNGKMPGLMIGP
jgi:hypothetical protein